MRSRTARGDDDVDAKRSRPSIGRTRDVPREQRARAFGWDPISGSHQGQRPQRPHSKAVYMAAPERFAEMSDFSLAPRAPSIHGTSLHFAIAKAVGRSWGKADRRDRWALSKSVANDPEPTWRAPCLGALANLSLARQEHGMTIPLADPKTGSTSFHSCYQGMSAISRSVMSSLPLGRIILKVMEMDVQRVHIGA